MWYFLLGLFVGAALALVFISIAAAGHEPEERTGHLTPDGTLCLTMPSFIPIEKVRRVRVMKATGEGLTAKDYTPEDME